MNHTERPEKRSGTLLDIYHQQKTQRRITIAAFVAIPLLLMIVFTILPLIEMFEFSFYDMRYIGRRKFVGLKNYIEVFKRKDIMASLKLSVFYIVGSVVQTSIALYLATILSFKLRGANNFKGVMFFPFLINGIAIGFIFKFFYTHGYVFDTILQAFGFELDKLPFWLKNQSTNNWAIVFGSVWRYFGRAMVLYIGAIMSIDSNIYEAADIDGA